MKRLRVLLIFLLLGFLVNIGVAVTLGLVSPFVDSSHEKVGGISVYGEFRTWFVVVRQSRGRKAILSIWISKNGGGRGITIPDRDGVPDEVLPYWASEFAYPVDTECQKTTRIMSAYGWPMISLWSGVQICTNVGPLTPGARRGIVSGAVGQASTSHAFFTDVVGGLQPWETTRLRRAPYGLIWAGLIVNTLIYAAVLFGFCFFVRKYRRASRRRRGLCQYCAYDLREVEHERCPECGRE